MPNKNETAISSIYDFESPDEGRIKDPNVAHEIANLEKPARERELQLEKEANESVTEDEKFFATVIEKLHEKYPKVPQTIVDGVPNFVFLDSLESFRRNKEQANSKGDPKLTLLVLTRKGLFYVGFDKPFYPLHSDVYDQLGQSFVRWVMKPRNRLQRFVSDFLEEGHPFESRMVGLDELVGVGGSGLSRLKSLCADIEKSKAADTRSENETRQARQHILDLIDK